jgi:hypothetical protein
VDERTLLLVIPYRWLPMMPIMGAMVASFIAVAARVLSSLKLSGIMILVERPAA